MVTYVAGHQKDIYLKDWYIPGKLHVSEHVTECNHGATEWSTSGVLVRLFKFRNPPTVIQKSKATHSDIHLTSRYVTAHYEFTRPSPY